MKPSEVQGLTSYPHLRAFVAGHLDMQFDDVRSMLQLPRIADGLTGVCNFAAVAWLCNLLSGFSELLYSPAPARGSTKRKKATGPGVAKKFINLLAAFYSWDESERRQVRERAGILYHLARTPLTHYLGVSQKKGAPRISIAKPSEPMSLEQLERLERATSLPPGLPLALTRERGGWVLNVPALYWGVFQLFRALTDDAGQMERAEARLRPRARRRPG